MRVTCAACATKYEIRDERVVGRVVKMRCKRCGDVIVVDGSGEKPLTGERNEASVLFSLAMLTRHEPPAPPPPPPDDISHLSAGGPFASALAPPALAPADDPPRRASWPVLAALVAGFALAAALPAAAVYAARPRTPPPAKAETATESET